MKPVMAERLKKIEKTKYEKVNVEIKEIFEEMQSIKKKILVVLEKNKHDNKHRSS